MADIQSNIDIRIDTSSALASIKLLQAQISAFHTSMAKGTAENVVASKQLQQKLIDSVNATGKFSAGIQSIKTTTESFTTSLEKNKLSLGQYFKYSIAATKSFGGAFKTEMATIDKVARERVKDLQTQYIQLGRDANGAMKSIAVRPLMLDLENLQTRTALAAQKQQILNQLLKQGSTNLLNFGKNTQWAGRQLMVGFTIPLSMAGTAAAKAYMDIEKASVQIRRVYGDLNTTATETNNMVNQIKTLAGEYTKYGIAISDTMDMAAKAAAMGKTGADLLAQVNQASKLSALGGVDQNMALETTISLTNAFGTSAEQLSSKINFLNAVENQTVLSIEDMTTAIPKAAPVIKQLGGDVEDLAFFMTAMKEGGINASEGANALKSGLSSLINPSQKASDFLMSFGVNVKAIVEQDKGNLKKTVVDFATALDKIDPLNRARAIEQMFGKFQFARISTLLQNVNKEGSQASRALELANMSSIQLAAISRKELEKLESSPMYKFQKSIADLQLKIAPIGESFLKAVTPIIEKVGDFLDGFNRMGDGFKQFVVVSSAILGGLAPILLMVTGLVANGAANIIKLFANVKAFLNRTSTESQILGETTNYLTTEQIKAEAVAASLDQTHTKLKQTFTSETSSIIALMEAYQGASAAMSRFNVPPISTSIGKGKKLATGGIIRGPGTGTSDSIAAMVSNGEAIIPAKNVARFPGLVNGLVSGNIPGFNKGKRGLAHSHAQEPLNPADYPEAYAEGMKDLGLDKLPQEIISRLKIQLLGSLTAELPQSANIRLREGQRGLSPDEWSGLFQTDGIFASSAATGGMDVKSPAAKKALAEFQERVRQNALDIALEKGLDTIHDPELAQATTRAMDQLGGQKGTMGDLVSTLRKRAATPGQFRATGSNALLKELEAEGSLTPDPTAPRYVTYRDTGTRIGRKRSSGVWNASLDPKKDYTGTYFGQPYMTGSPARQTEEYNNTLATTAKTASESKRTRKIAKDTVDGYANELERSKKKVATTANKTTQSESDYILRQLDVRKKHAEMVGAETASIEKEIAARRMQIAATEKAILEERSLAAQRSVQSAAAVGPVAVGSNRGTFSSRFSGAVERGLTRGAGRLANLGTGRLAGVGMAASMATFGLAGAGGAVGDVANQLLPIVSILSAVGPIFRSFLPKLVEFIPMIARFAGPVGLAVTGITLLVGAVKLVNEAVTKEAKDRLASSEKVIGAQNAMQKSFKSVASLLGTEVAPKNAYQLATAAYKTKSANVKQANDVQTLLSNPDFKDKNSDIGKFVDSLKKMSSSAAESMILQYANTLKASGVADKTIDAFILALQSASGQKTLSLKFASVDFGTRAGMGELADATKLGESDLKAARAAAAAKNAIPKDIIARTQKILESGIDPNTKQPLDKYTKKQYEGTIKMRQKEIANSTETQTFKNLFAAKKDEITGNLSSMVTMLGKGSLGIKTFMSNIKSYAGVIKTLPEAKAALLSSFSGFGPEATKAANKVKSVNDQLLLMAYLSSHTDAENSQLLTDINSSDTALQKKALAKIRNPSVQLSGAKESYGTEGITGGSAKADPYKDFLKSIDDKRKSVAAELSIRRQLLRTGMDVADAEKLASDSAAQQAYMGAKTAEQKAKVISSLRTQLALDKQLLTVEEKKAQADQKAVDKQQKKIELKKAQLKIPEQQAQIAQYNDALNVLGTRETEINKAYDERSAALDKIQKSQEAISAAQKDQLTVADALSKGDIAAAARAAQDSRANSAQRAMDTQKTQLDSARQAELNALTVSVNGKLMTRKDIELQIETIQARINKLQLDEISGMEIALSQLQDAATISSQAAETTATPQSVVKAKPKVAPKALVPKIAPTPKPKPKTSNQLGNGRSNVGMRSQGGLIPKYFVDGGFAVGTDTVPAMLTPGEFIVSQPAVKNFGLDNLRAINSGSSVGDSVYNYSLSVNMSGSNLNPDDVARTVMAQIRQVDSQRLRGNRL